MKFSKTEKKIFSTLFKNVKNRSKTILISLATVITAGVSGVFIIKSTNILDAIGETDNQDALDSGLTREEKIRELYEKYSNKIVYIETERVGNLSLLGRFRHALFCINLSNKIKSQHYSDKAINELAKLGSNNLNDSQAEIIRQLLMDNQDLIFNLATNPKIDNRIFPNAGTPSIQQDLIKFQRKPVNETQIEDDKISLSDDTDFNFIFDFFETTIKNMNSNSKINSESLKFYSKKFISTLSALKTHDYKLRHRHTILNDPTFLHDDGFQDNKYSLSESEINLTKNEFLYKLEYLILQILDSYSLLNESDFIKIGGNLNYKLKLK